MSIPPEPSESPFTGTPPDGQPASGEQGASAEEGAGYSAEAIPLEEDARALPERLTYTVGQVVARLGGRLHENTIRNWGRDFGEFLSAQGQGGRGKMRLYTKDDLIVLNTVRALREEGHLDIDSIRRALRAERRVYRLPHVPSEAERDIAEQERPVSRSRFLALASQAQALQLQVGHLQDELERVNRELAQRMNDYAELSADHRVTLAELGQRQAEIADLRVERERLLAQVKDEQGRAGAERQRAWGLSAAAAVIIAGLCLLLVIAALLIVPPLLP
jgi:DNA-binding transcriptional MerR regulator